MESEKSFSELWPPYYIHQVYNSIDKNIVIDSFSLLPSIPEIEIIMDFLKRVKRKGSEYIDVHNKKVWAEWGRPKTGEELEVLASRAGIDWNFRTDTPKGRRKSGYGYIYLMECGGLCKIGITKKNPEKRLKAYQTANPFDKTILFCKEVLNYQETEEKIKTKFHHRLQKGKEWFAFSKDDISRITKHLEKRSKK